MARGSALIGFRETTGAITISASRSAGDKAWRTISAAIAIDAALSRILYDRDYGRRSP